MIIVMPAVVYTYQPTAAVSISITVPLSNFAASIAVVAMPKYSALNINTLD